MPKKFHNFALTLSRFFCALAFSMIFFRPFLFLNSFNLYWKSTLCCSVQTHSKLTVHFFRFPLESRCFVCLRYLCRRRRRRRRQCHRATRCTVTMCHFRWKWERSHTLALQMFSFDCRIDVKPNQFRPWNSNLIFWTGTFDQMLIVKWNIFSLTKIRLLLSGWNFVVIVSYHRTKE